MMIRDPFDQRERFVLAMLLLGWGPRRALEDLWNTAVEARRRLAWRDRLDGV